MTLVLPWWFCRSLLSRPDTPPSVGQNDGRHRPGRVNPLRGSGFALDTTNPAPKHRHIPTKGACGGSRRKGLVASPTTMPTPQLGGHCRRVSSERGVRATTAWTRPRRVRYAAADPEPRCAWQPGRRERRDCHSSASPSSRGKSLTAAQITIRVFRAGRRMRHCSCVKKPTDQR